MEHFAPYAVKCGSPYTAIDVDLVSDNLLIGSKAVRKCWWSLLTMLILVLIEIMPLVLVVFGCFFAMARGLCAICDCCNYSCFDCALPFFASKEDLEEPLDVVV